MNDEITPWANPADVLVIAEIGVNHDGDPAKALSLIDQAKEAGADAVKFQLFHPDRLLSNQAMLAGYQKEAGARSPRGMLAKLMLDEGAFQAVAQRCRELSLKLIVTPFSLGDIPILAELKVAAIKIASPDAVNAPLIWAAASLNKPLIVSTGTCTLAELGPTANLLRQHPFGAALLQCVSSYPVAADQACLSGIGDMAHRLGLAVGYSDHTQEPITGALAVASGARIIEKHFTFDSTAAGPDHAASLTPREFAQYVKLIRLAQAMRGTKGKQVQLCETDVTKVSRQSLCATRDLPQGHRLTADDLTTKRPGTGIAAGAFEATIGRTLAKAVKANDLLEPGDLA